MSSNIPQLAEVVESVSCWSSSFFSLAVRFANSNEEKSDN